MNLTSELFEQIAASLSRGPAAGDTTAAGAIAATTVATEQRSGPRVSTGVRQRARLIPLTDAIAPGPVDVTLRDVAPGGARFLYAARIPLDEQFVLVLPSTDGPVAILCGVAYWQPVAEDLFAIGAKFTRVLRQGSSATHARPAPAHAAVRRAV